jgi:hypothetical protein
MSDEQPDDPGQHPPTSSRVARRALALTAVTARAILEQGNVDLGLAKPKWNPLTWARHFLADQKRQHQALLAWINLLGIEDEFEPNEWQVLQRPPRHLLSQEQINSTWRLEGLAVLAWALGRFDIPPHDELVECHSLWQSLGILDTAGCKALLVDAALRPIPEIQALRRRLLAIHWRLVNYRLRPEAIDFVAVTEQSFAEFDRTWWFSPEEVAALPLVGGDLAVEGARLDRATQDAFSKASSTALERHMASNWLLDGPERYSETSADT